MFKVIDLSSTIYNAYEANKFSLTKWEEYLSELPYVKDLCLTEMKQNVTLTYLGDDYYLPVLDAVVDNKNEVLKLQESFNIVINFLKDKIIKKFCRKLDVEIVLYLGLCNGAGWVNEFCDKTLILLGIEK